MFFLNSILCIFGTGKSKRSISNFARLIKLYQMPFSKQPLSKLFVMNDLEIKCDEMGTNANIR